MQLAYPLMLALLPLYVALRLGLRWLSGERVQYVPYPTGSILHDLPRSFRQLMRAPTLGLLEFLFIGALTCAAARPFTEFRVEGEKEARNVMLTIDLSRSMEAEDFGTSLRAQSRIEGVKRVISEFIRTRHDDRLGLVVFGNQAFVQAPLTLDRELVAQIVEQLSAGIAGDGTAIGDGLALSIKRLKDVAGNSKAIILLTDGANNAGQFKPLKAAELAKELGIKVHTIGLGSNKNVRKVVSNGIFSQTVYQKAEFDEETLKKVAETTGGIYFNAANLNQLRAVYEQIEKLENTQSDNPDQVHIDEHFLPFALAALLTYILLIVSSRTVFLRLP